MRGGWLWFCFWASSVLGQMVINVPDEPLVECRPIRFTWTAGIPPYNFSVHVAHISDAFEQLIFEEVRDVEEGFWQPMEDASGPLYFVQVVDSTGFGTRSQFFTVAESFDMICFDFTISSTSYRTSSAEFMSPTVFTSTSEGQVITVTEYVFPTAAGAVSSESSEREPFLHGVNLIAVAVVVSVVVLCGIAACLVCVRRRRRRIAQRALHARSQSVSGMSQAALLASTPSTPSSSSDLASLAAADGRQWLNSPPPISSRTRRGGNTLSRNTTRRSGRPPSTVPSTTTGYPSSMHSSRPSFSSTSYAPSSSTYAQSSSTFAYPYAPSSSYYPGSSVYGPSSRRANPTRSIRSDPRRNNEGTMSAVFSDLSSVTSHDTGNGMQQQQQQQRGWMTFSSEEGSTRPPSYRSTVKEEG